MAEARNEARNEVRTCKYCDRELSSRDIMQRNRACARCRYKLVLIREFIKACDEFKKVTDYDEILRKREERNENFNQKVSR